MSLSRPFRTSPADFTIVLADPGQSVEHSRAKWESWSRNLDFSTFYEEQITRRRSGPWAQNHALLAWVLVRRDEPLGEVYAACETYRRAAWIKTTEGSVEKGYMYGIASVVTPSSHRRNGYATHMLRLLHYMLAPAEFMPPFPNAWGAPPPLPGDPQQTGALGQDPDSIPRSIPSAPSYAAPSFLEGPRPDYLPAALGSILWSDVGANFYSKCTIGLSAPGWIVDPQTNTELLWELSDPPSSVLQDWEILYRKDLPSISDALSAAAQQALQGGPVGSWATDPSSPGLLAFTPLRDPWSKRSLRSRWDSLPVGLRLRRSSSGEEVIALFATHNDAIADSLLVTLLHHVTPEILPGLLDALDFMGRKEGRTEGVMWGLERDGPLAETWREARLIKSDGQRPEEDGHLLGVAWYGSQEEGKRGRLMDTQMWGWC